MFTYILRRLLISIPILLLVVTAVFFAFKLIPGDPAQVYAGETATQAQVEAIRAEFGLDRPVLVQYANYMSRLLRGDLGKSISTRRPVIVEIQSRFWNTVKLSIAAIVVATALGMLMGIGSAVNRNGIVDNFFSIIGLAGISVPIFWLGLLMTILFSVQLKWLPTSGDGTWLHYIMPTINLAVFSLAFIMRMTRSSLLETLQEDYVRTARAKGVPEAAVLARHSLRNALLPIVTVVGLRFGYMLGGSVITEQIFVWPGMGRLLIVAVSQRDIPIVQGVLLVFAASFFFVNLIVDILYGFVDPRIRR